MHAGIIVCGMLVGVWIGSFGIAHTGVLDAYTARTTRVLYGKIIAHTSASHTIEFQPFNETHTRPLIITYTDETVWSSFSATNAQTAVKVLNADLSDAQPGQMAEIRFADDTEQFSANRITLHTP